MCVSLSVSHVDLVGTVYLEEAKIKWLNDPKFLLAIQSWVLGLNGERTEVKDKSIYVQLSGLCQSMVWWLIVSTLLL